MTETETATTCYRHPDRETRVACSNCGRPICPDCMIPTPVGMRCPECAREKTQVRRLQSGPSRQTTPATYALIGLCLAAFVGEIATGFGASTFQNGFSRLTAEGAMSASAVADGQWYRILTNGFLHYGIFHLGLNMVALYFLGALLEPGIGTGRFVGLFLVSVLGGSLGVVLLQPDSFAAGASGGVFGLLSAGFLFARRRGLDMIAQQLGFFVLLNLGFTFLYPGISIGGHLGGLVAGGVAALVMTSLERKGGSNRGLFEGAFLVALGAVIAVATVALS